MSEKRYTQNWRAYNQAQQREKALFMKILAYLCSGIEDLEYKFGRPRHSLSDMIYCSAFKVYSLYSGRRFMSDVRFAHEKGYISKAPHYNTLSRYMSKEELTPLLENLIVESSLPLRSVETDFATDSTGFSTNIYDRWFDYKWTSKGKYTRHKDYVKAHVTCGVSTHIVTSAMLTDGTANDSPYFEPMVKETSKNFLIGEVSADKAYSSKANLECVRNVGGTPYIPFKKNTSGKARGSPLWRQMYHQFMANRELFDNHYHKRSNVESVFGMIKAKFGPNVRSKSRTAQFNEVLNKILCHNLCVLIQEAHEMGLDQVQAKNQVWTNPQTA